MRSEGTIRYPNAITAHSVSRTVARSYSFSLSGSSLNETKSGCSRFSADRTGPHVQFSACLLEAQTLWTCSASCSQRSSRCRGKDTPSVTEGIGWYLLSAISAWCQAGGICAVAIAVNHGTSLFKWVVSFAAAGRLRSSSCAKKSKIDAPKQRNT
jgi:hypothetical protein